MIYATSASSVPSVSARSESPARQSTKELLFGEIDSTGTQYDKDLPTLRLISHDFSNRVAPFLFKDLSVTFKTTTFGKQARLAALERIGHHVQILSFNVPHTPDTFLPPLISPTTGEERIFIYTPQVHPPATLIGKVKQPKYGSWDLVDLLVKQYPPLFHAATNVPAFIRAFSSLPNLEHLKVSCPDQDITQRHRRSIVDYALISMRIALESTPLYSLDTLTFNPIHPAGLLYLQPMLGFGASPRSAKRWAQISTISIEMAGIPGTTALQLDHLKILHKYLQNFSSSLQRFTFRWVGDKGPFPLSLDLEPAFQQIHDYDPAAPHCLPRQLQLPKLRYMELENAVMDAHQISTFVMRQRRTLDEFKFEKIALRSGTWDDALAPLTHIAREGDGTTKHEEVMDVPLIFNPTSIEDGAARLHKAQRGSDTLNRWLSRAKHVKEKVKSKEQRLSGTEHVKKLLRSSVFPWR